MHVYIYIYIHIYMMHDRVWQPVRVRQHDRARQGVRGGIGKAARTPSGRISVSYKRIG